LKSSAMLKAAGYRPPTVPDPHTPKNMETIQLCIEACESLYYGNIALAQKIGWVDARPITLLEIYYAVKAKIIALRKLSQQSGQNLWPYTDEVYKRYIDRMVNFAAAPSTFENEIPALICVQPGLYMPNLNRIRGDVKEIGN